MILKVTIGRNPDIKKGTLKQFVVDKKDEYLKLIITDPDNIKTYQEVLKVLNEITEICDNRNRY